MKKLLALLLAMVMIVMAFSMMACNGDTPDTPDVPADDQQDTADTSDDVDEQEPDDEISEDQEEADKVIDRINKIEDITASTWKANENKIEYARKYYDKLTDAQKALVGDEMLAKLEAAEAAYAAFYEANEQAKALTINKIAASSPRIDGSLEGYYVMGSALTLDGVTVYFTYDKTYLYVYAKNTAKTEITVDLACNSALVCTLTLSTDGLSVAKDGAALGGEYPTDVKLTDNGFTLEAAITMEDIGIEDDNFKDKEMGASFACGSSKYTGYGDPAAFERFYTIDSAYYNYMAVGTPTIDGEMDELYLNAHAITLSQDVVNGFSSAETKLGGGWQGDTSVTDSADMHTTFRFAVDDEYLYIIEHRFDYYPAWKSDSFNKPFRADGSLLWFSKDNDLGAGIAWNRALRDYNGPVFGLFFDNGQASAVEKNWEFAIKQYLTDCEYIMEVKVPLVDLELTRADFEEARISFTFCSADVVDINYDATNFSWTGTAYQMNYIGVNTWGSDNKAETKMPLLLVNTTDQTMSSMPELSGPWAPDYALEHDTWDPMKGVEPKPFDTFPINEATGYLTDEYTREQLDSWYEQEYDSKLKYNFNRDNLPTLAEGVELITVNNPSRNTTAGFYCDPVGSYAGISVDLTKYQDALVVFSSGQNLVLEVSTDGENWTELYNYITVYSTPTTNTSLVHGFAIDSTIYAADAQTLYIRVGQAKDTSGWGGTLQGVSIYY